MLAAEKTASVQKAARIPFRDSFQHIDEGLAGGEMLNDLGTLQWANHTSSPIRMTNPQPFPHPLVIHRAVYYRWPAL